MRMQCLSHENLFTHWGKFTWLSYLWVHFTLTDNACITRKKKCYMA